MAMEIQLHNTEKVVFLNGVPARIWEGQTASGVRIHAYITRIGVEDSQDLAEFEGELATASAPSREMEAIPLRMLI